MGKRGRPKKSVEEATAFITDASINPYKIRIGERSYDVVKGDEIQPESYHTKLENALNFIARQKTSKSKTYSIAEYLKELSDNQKQIAEAIKSVGVKEELV